MAEALRRYLEDDQIPMTDEEMLMSQSPGLGQYVAPPAEEQIAGANQATVKGKELIGDQQMGISQLRQYIKDYSKEKSPIDWTPLAAYLDSTMGGNMTEAAKAMRGPTKMERAEKMMGLQSTLAQRENEVSKAQAAERQAQGMQNYRLTQQDLYKQAEARKAAGLDILTQAEERKTKTDERLAAQAEKKFEHDQQMFKLYQDKQAEVERKNKELEEYREKYLATQTQKDKDKAEIGKTLTSSETEQLADIETQIQSAGDLLTNWREKVGPTNDVIDYGKKIGASKIPNTPESIYMDNVKLKAQTIGKALEGGKLTDADYERKYMKFLPQPGDSDARAEERVQQLQKLMRDTHKTRVDTFGKAGYNVKKLSLPDAPMERKIWQGKTYEKQGNQWVEVH